MWYLGEGKAIRGKMLNRGLGVTRSDRREIWGNFLGVMKMFLTSFLLVLSWRYIFVKTHWTIHLKRVNFTVHKLYVNKPDFKKWHCLMVLSHSSLALQWNWAALYLFASYSPSLENYLFILLQNCLQSLRLFPFNRDNLLIMSVILANFFSPEFLLPLFVTILFYLT